MSYTNPHEDPEDKPPINNTLVWSIAILLFVLTAPFVAKAIFTMMIPAPEELASDIVKHSVNRSNEMMDRSGMNRAFDDLARESQRRRAQRVYEERARSVHSVTNER